MNSKNFKVFRTPVLTFHSIREKFQNDKYAISPSFFEEIIAFIVKRFGTIGIKEISTELQSKKGVDNGRVLITFDDGYRDNFQYAIPILQKYDVKAVFFLIPKYLGESNLWDARARVIIDHLTISEAKEIVRIGHEIGSHSLTHHSLIKFDRNGLTKELRDSKEELIEKLGVEPISFSYPYGDFNDEVGKITSKHYQYAFATDKGTNSNWFESNFMGIRREGVLDNMTLNDLEKMIVNYLG